MGGQVIEYIPFICAVMVLLMLSRVADVYVRRFARSLEASPKLKKARQDAALAALPQRDRKLLEQRTIDENPPRGFASWDHYDSHKESEGPR
jgi:hypothetical protein